MDLDSARNIATVASCVAAWAALGVSVLNLWKSRHDRTGRLRLSCLERRESEQNLRYLIIRVINEGRRVEIERATVRISERQPKELRNIWFGPVGIRRRGRARKERDVELTPQIHGHSLEVLPHGTLDLSTPWPD